MAVLICLPMFLSAQKKQSLIKRAYVNTVARYNYYFNASIKVQNAKRDAALAHIDDFNEVVHVFPFSTQDNLKNNLPAMDEAILKCNHIIHRRTSSKWVDNSWLLSGQAQFFKGDFFAALECFEFIARAYKGNSIRYEAEIWSIKSFLMLGKYDEAVALSSILMADPLFPKKFKKELHLVYAEGLIYQEKLIEALAQLEKAIPKVKRNEYRYRRHFVAGQLAMKIDKPNDAIRYFEKVTRSNAPYLFDFFARINMVRIHSSPTIKNYKKGRQILVSMIKDDKNLDLLDQIYYELAVIEMMTGDAELAIEHFKLALSSGQSNPKLKSDIYLTLAELYFNKEIFVQSQKYYDSAVQVLSPEIDGYADISNKHQILTSLIENLVEINLQDSLLKLARDPKFRTTTLNKIKEEELKKKEEEEFLKNNPLNDNRFMDAGTGGGGMGGPGQQMSFSMGFPFYDARLKTKGINDFKLAWGNRKLGDYWRIESIAKDDNNTITTQNKNEGVTDIPQDSVSNDKELTISSKNFPTDIHPDDISYFANVPFDLEEQKAAESIMGRCYFQAGSIYREKLNQPDKAVSLLEEMIRKLKPNEYRENVFFLLYKVHQSNGNIDKANHIFTLLEEEFPNSEFIEIIKNPETIKEKKTVKSPDDLLKDLYHQFYQHHLNGQLDSVEWYYKHAKSAFPANALEGQFDFIYAESRIKKGQKKEYVDIMRSISVNYSGTPIGDMAEERLTAFYRLFPDMAQSNDVPSSAPKKQPDIIYPYQKSDPLSGFHFVMKVDKSMDFNIIRIAFSDFNNDFRKNKPLKITTSFVGSTTRILVVSGFETLSEAEEYVKDIKINHQLMSKFPENFEKKEFMYISKDNFSILLREKAFEVYQNYFYKTYL